MYHRFRSAFQDMVRSVGMWRIVWRISRDDLIQRYVRSILGPIWITIGSALYIIGLGTFWSLVFNYDAKEFLPYLAAGLIIWQYMTGVITEGFSTFTRGASIITGMSIPLGFHVFRQVARQVITFAHTLPVAIAVALFFGVGIHGETWLLIPGLILTIVNSLWVSLLLGVIGARFEDFAVLIRMSIPFLFFVTPILWLPDQLGTLSHYVNLNPFYHFIEIVRAPILGTSPSFENYVAVAAVTVFGWVAAMLVFVRTQHRIAFWL